MSISETETIIKRVLPYLERRGYDLQNDISFEEPAALDSDFKKGFIDISVHLGKKSPVFLIEAKRDGTKLTAKHRKQVLDYGASKKCLFVAVTNGQYFELLNTATKNSLRLNGTAFNKLPRKSDLIANVISQLKKNPRLEDISIKKDNGIPYRPGLPLTKLNHLIQQCHNSIRKIEKNEEHAFADFSKILFLKLLEEKWDIENVPPKYSYYFHELADTPADRADQVSTAIKSMIKTVREETKFGAVLNDPIKLKQNATYLSIVKKIAGVSWNDCNLDSKGTAFEYFVRATLKGKKLGQYFTPRPLVQLMLHLGRYGQILTALTTSQPFKVLDPACGTGGFLVYAMNKCLTDIAVLQKKKKLHESVAKSLRKKIKEETFFGIDAHEGVASSAKMNMIIAGDGHNNIKCDDSLKADFLIPNYTNGEGVKSNKAHLILSNPPFGTSEAESLNAHDLLKYKIKSTKGQSLFIQRMIASIEDDSLIVTVIDEGVLNTTTYKELRRHILEECRIEYVIALPDETFKPNKINVKSSVLVLRKRSDRDDELEDEYPVIFIRLSSLGYDPSGAELRGFNIDQLIAEVSSDTLFDESIGNKIKGYNWCGYIGSSLSISSDETYRMDYKYWELDAITSIDQIKRQKGAQTIAEVNLITTKRGNSPSAAEYVSETEGAALVVKAGSNISKQGTLSKVDADYIEDGLLLSYREKGQVLEEGDILLSSTGDGTLGKCCVYRNNSDPAIADGHVTVIRVDQKKIHPEYLCDYLRKGFGADQIVRLYTGSTGLIEITPEDVNKVIIPPLPQLKDQIAMSNKLRETEKESEISIRKIFENLKKEESNFHGLSKNAKRKNNNM